VHGWRALEPLSLFILSDQLFSVVVVVKNRFPLVFVPSESATNFDHVMT
jgi:hypothetical protein